MLGLSHLRYLATPDQIKIARTLSVYLSLKVKSRHSSLAPKKNKDRKKVLKHHPDKKAGSAGSTNDDAFFKCIQKALEVLSNPERRRQYDSIDQHFIDLESSDVPTQSAAKKAVDKKPDEFFALFAPIFIRKARFSKKEPVPQLGAMDAPKEAVEEFYDFWYNFDSWRSFEYLDKEVNEGSDKCVYLASLFCLFFG